MGKIVVFWSPLHGQARVTASMGAVAMAFSELWEERVVMTHTQFGMADMEGMFDLRTKEEQKQVLYESAGLNALILNFKQAELKKESIDRCSMQMPNTNNLFMLPGLTKEAALLQGDELEDMLEYMLTERVTKGYDWVFIDLASGKNAFSKRLMEKADVVVVTLSQNVATWDTLFQNYKDIVERENVFFLFGAHKASSKFNVKNFKRMYRKYADGINTGVVPDCVGYMDAVSDGLVSTFYLMNEYVKRKEENYVFITECKESAKKIRALAKKESTKGGRGKP